MLSISQRDFSSSSLPVSRLAEADSWTDLPRVAYILTDDETLRRSLEATVEEYGAAAVWLRSITEYRACERGDAIACLLISQCKTSSAEPDSQRMLSAALCPPVIVLSEDGDIASCVRAIKEGAHDYLPMPIAAPHLFSAMEAAFEKDRALRIQRQEKALLQRRWRSLTVREAEIMRYAVEGFLNKQTAAELNITENTVQVHRGRVMRKMGAESFAELVRMSLKLAAPEEGSLVLTRRI